MRKIIILMALLALNLTAGAENRSWNFGVISQADRDAMKADASNWNYDSKNDRYQYLNALNDEPALARRPTAGCRKRTALHRDRIEQR